MAQKNLAA